ncbi:Tex family protein [Melioribacter sp. OK-6-Me]|uniref:Tex family protein n=1 Tax=unclassified Melioribacter TaxID=2627329 RepID=UPI003ED95AC1
MDYFLLIAREIGINKEQVISSVNLFNEGSTVPFIARYRKERTGGLDETQLRLIEEKYNYYNLLEERKQTVLKSIEEQGKLTPELEEKIRNAIKLQTVEDLYLPYRPKRKTRATIAIAKGLEPLADFILNNPLFKGKLEDEASKYIDPEKGVETVEEALQGAKDIIAERISDAAEVREAVREYLLENSIISSEKAQVKPEERDKNKKDVYEVYHNFSIHIKNIKPYQTLAINRGEREKFLKVSLSYDRLEVEKIIYKKFIPFDKTVFEDLLKETVSDSLIRLISPSIEREIRNYLTEQADNHAIEVFATNLRQLLLQPPISGKIIMGIDPGYISGCKAAVIDTTGKYLEGTTIYPHEPQKKIEAARKVILDLIKKYGVDLIAIGNGTASRETEMLIAEIIQENKLDTKYLIVSEAGASVYSASELAKSEFPDLEAAQRGNISIARRVLDPLAELVKIDPKSIGVGLYQHDVDQKNLSKKLDDVVVSCVNYVGVDLNTASLSLLSYVSGLTKPIAKRIIDYREKHGRFKSREELKKIRGIGDKVFEQSAGFLKILGGDNPLDNTFIHPESYGAVQNLLELAGISATEISKKGNLIDLYVKSKGIEKIAEKVGVGIPTLKDIIDNLKKPGRDPREDLPKPILRSDVLKMEDLKIGMRLKGTIRNIVDFGAFVDIGVKHDGLIHISQMSNRFVKNPFDIINVGDIVEVEILNVDIEKERISLKLIGNSNDL